MAEITECCARDLLIGETCDACGKTAQALPLAGGGAVVRSYLTATVAIDSDEESDPIAPGDHRP